MLAFQNTTQKFLDQWWKETLRPLLANKDFKTARIEVESIFGSPEIKSTLEEVASSLIIDTTREMEDKSIPLIEVRLAEKLNEMGYDTFGEILRIHPSKLKHFGRIGDTSVKSLARVMLPIIPLWEFEPDVFIALIAKNVICFNQLLALDGEWVREHFPPQIRAKIMARMKKRRELTGEMF